MHIRVNTTSRLISALWIQYLFCATFKLLMMKQDIDQDLNIILCFSRVVVEKFKNFEGQQKIRLSYKKKEYTLVTITYLQSNLLTSLCSDI